MNENHEIINDILEINRRVCFDLWNMTNVKSKPKGLAPRLIMPKKRSGDIRISEQESRLLYCGVLNSLNYYYSIETPTKETYTQKGQTQMSASSDLSLYINDGAIFEKACNVEFKAHNPTYEDIRKDIEKLIREGIIGNWFHTLKNVDTKTLPTLFDKFKKSFLDCKEKKFFHDNFSVVFCFSVIDMKWAVMKCFNYNHTKTDLDAYLEDFFKLKYYIRQKKIILTEGNYWSVVQTDTPAITL